MKKNESLLIPAGSPQHVVSLLVTKIQHKLFEFSLYNTGQGISKWHSRFENTNCFQTSLSFDKIPEESILDVEGWNDLYKKSKTAENMDFLYSAIHDKLTKGGNLLPAPLFKQYYDSGQVTGVCAMQCIMSPFRSKIMDLSYGSPAEKEASYKLIKTLKFKVYYKAQQNLIDSTIQSHLPSVLMKLEAEIKMVEIAQDNVNFKVAINHMGILLKVDVLAQYPEELLQTTMGRYAVLREASTELGKAWLNDPSTLIPENVNQMNALQLATAKFEHQKAIIQNYKFRLQQIAENGNSLQLAKALFGIYRFSRYIELAISETVNYISNEHLIFKSIKMLLKNLFAIKGFSETVQKLISKVEKSGKTELSAKMRNYWLSLS
jgi:hypothetical protein